MMMSKVNLCLVCTCKPSGFQRTFLSRAGVELSVFWGLFFSVRMTPQGSSRRALTRFFSCHPTWGTHTADSYNYGVEKCNWESSKNATPSEPTVVEVERKFQLKKQFLNISEVIFAACWGDDILQPSVVTNGDQSSCSISVISIQSEPILTSDPWHQ